MKFENFFKNKRWTLLVLLITLLGVLIYFFVLPRNEVSEDEIPKDFRDDEVAPISSIYKYDWRAKEYIPDSGEGWQSLSFIRYIYDLDEESGLDTCYYFIYDNIREEISGGSSRRCNHNLIIRVGPEGVCSSQGKKACTLYVFATDRRGNGTMEADRDITPPRFETAAYHIDWEEPKVGKIYIENQEVKDIIDIEKDKPLTYLAKVSDNIELNYCWLYINGENVKKMEIRPNPCQNGTECKASVEYTFTEGETHFIWTRCADHYSPETNGYLNISAGLPVKVILAVNHPPEISSCKVTPTQGTLETEFQFEVEAIDIDEDKLSYKWDFGDGESSSQQNPQYHYLAVGTYQPKVEVLDNKGGKDNCSTAWVTVSE